MGAECLCGRSGDAVRLLLEAYADGGQDDACLPEPVVSVFVCRGRGVLSDGRAVHDGGEGDIVLRGTLAKFSQNAELREYLLGTGDAVLVEASPYDRIWGVGLAQDDPLIRDPGNWRGENLIGFVLMEARDTLRAEEAYVDALL